MPSERPRAVALARQGQLGERPGIALDLHDDDEGVAEEYALPFRSQWSAGGSPGDDESPAQVPRHGRNRTCS